VFYTGCCALYVGHTIDPDSHLQRMATSPLYDLIVIGGGVVGLACLRAATLEGWNCCLVEAESDLLSHASGT
jgi:glycerol-3-phosphate dehydrogenase